ncbi:RecQ family ATP-dependent DNA helicase [Pseudalkalibacillus caeni]|uniref:RecQ family ATP-dependent DNA helicase n=1 Tax=Exobacillus caeni TaxID=2574798 RepID=A0A5R9EXN9_9BACL|nr:ATP-dependent DNA helicase RecQ [Pseudalkalibacillus caeni]TLS35621.1 RecQ family ATP-dependent DNA helicase [Pseudalkalibacillus caeni]
MNLQRLLQKHFGFSTFRKGQQEIINDVVQGKNVLAMLPTGTGKSICYQLPGYILPGIILVVSPLLSLMEDQVQQLKSNGEKRALALNSFLSLSERKTALSNLAQYKYIYVSPEILQHPIIQKKLRDAGVSLFVIDEAHCISQWGHEFRTDYLKLSGVREILGNPPCLALTATATEAVRKDILSQLQLDDAESHIYGIDRSNIAIKVEEHQSVEEKVTALLDYSSKLKGPGIVYFSSRVWAERMAALIEEQKVGRVAFYHAGMEMEDRLLIQKQFINDEIDLICSTNAFGMGINKPNVRYVIHFHFPGTIEAYLQEIGRAGRDGAESLAVLLYTKEDYQLPAMLMQQEVPEDKQVSGVLDYLFSMGGNQLTPEAEKSMIQAVGLSEVAWGFLAFHLGKRGVIMEDNFIKPFDLKSTFASLKGIIEERTRVKLNRLYEMNRWLEREGCRRQNYLGHFDQCLEETPEHCCDYCGITLSKYEKRDELNRTRLQEKFLWKKELTRLFHQSEEVGIEE